MKVNIPKGESYMPLITNLRQVYDVEESDDSWVITVERDIIIPREWSGLSRWAFRRLGRRIQVFEGVKRVTDEEVSAQLLRKRVIKVHVTQEEEKLLAEAARRTGRRTAEFMRESALSRAVSMLGPKAGSANPGGVAEKQRNPYIP